MKKLIFFISSILMFMGLFFVFDNKSFASDLHSLPNVINFSYSPSYRTGNGWENESSIRFQVRNPSSSAGIACVQVTSSQYKCYSVDYVLNGSSSSDILKTYIYCGTNPNNEMLSSSYAPSNSPAGWYESQSGQVNSFNVRDGSTLSINGPVFESLLAAENYIRYGDTDGVISDEGDFLQPDINWGSNGDPYYGEPSDDIPAPRFEVSYFNDGAVRKSITFLNAEYDSRSQNGRYGLVLSMKWCSVDDFTITQKGGLLSKDYNVYYQTLLPFGDMVDVYGVPQKESQIIYCPQSFFFTQNSITLDAYDDYLETYPIASRNVSGDIDTFFKSYLAEPNCPYNTLVFTCCYYKKMSDGTFKFGPYTTGTFYPPDQGAIFNAGNRVDSNSSGMLPGNGGGANGTSDNPFGGNPWSQNWGNGSNPNIDYGTNIDPQSLISNMNGLFGLIGDMPGFVAQLISFLPDWILSFIAVSLGLAIAIGVVKLFIG